MWGGGVTHSAVDFAVCSVSVCDGGVRDPSGHLSCPNYLLQDLVVQTCEVSEAGCDEAPQDA